MRNMESRKPLFWGLVLGVPLAAVLAHLFVVGLVIGDRVPDGLDIENRTDQELHVYVVLPDGTEVSSVVVPPDSTLDSYIDCASTRMLAKADGSVVASRGPFQDCNMDTWIISADSA